MYAIGIDLGTTNSVAAVFRRGKKESLAIDNGRYRLPSVVSFRKGEVPLVGQTAKARLLVDPENTVSSAKRFMGDVQKNYRVHGGTHTPVDIAEMVLKKIVEGARACLGEEIQEAVITVPAYFTEDQRANTKRAGERAGLRVLRLLPEPSAAAISYGVDRHRNQTIMVYDLGGGTFDVSVLRVEGNDFKVIAVGGDAELGGDDFDNVIVAWIIQEFKRRTGADVMRAPGRDLAVALQKLKEAAEQAKIELSQSDQTDIMLSELMGHSLALTLDIQTFNELTRALVAKTITCVHTVLRDAHLDAGDIDRVILIGGSTRVRAVRELVSREIKEPYQDESPDDAVAWGAAIVAADLSAPDQDNVPGLSVLEVTAHTLGIDMMEEADLVMVPVIPRNTHYPYEAGVVGWSMKAFQELVRVRVFRGELRLVEQNTYLGRLSMKLRPPRAERVPVVNLFRLDADGILHFRAVDLPEPERHAEVARLLDHASDNAGFIDVKLFESLVKNGTISTPTEIKVDTLALK
jgi:molecular chaperone DnaK (HSP70)